MTSSFPSIPYKFKQTQLWVQILFCALFVYISLVPYYYLQQQSLTEEIPPFSLAKYGPFFLITFVILFWIIERVFKRRKWVRSRIDPFLSIYLVVSLCSLIGAEYTYIGLAKWLYHNTTGGVLCVMLFQYCTSWKVIKTIASVMCLVSGIVVLYTFAFSLLGADPIWGEIQNSYNPYYTRDRATGPFGHTVATASYTMLFFPLAIWLLISLKKINPKILWALVCLLFIPVIILTQTRGALLSIGLCGVVMTPWIRGLRFDRNLSHHRLITGLGLAVFMLFFILSKPALLDPVQERLSRLAQRWHEGTDPSSITITHGDREYHYGSLLEYTERFRIAQYKVVAHYLNNHPFLGVGFGNYSRIFEKEKYERTNEEIWTVIAHTTENMYLLFLVETGWVGLASRLLLLGVVFIVVFRRYRQIADGDQRKLLLAILAGQSGLAFNMLTWDILNEPTMRMASWMLIGLALATARCDNALNE